MENFESTSENRLSIKTLAVAFLKRIENFALLKPAANCRRQVSPRRLCGDSLYSDWPSDIRKLSKRCQNFIKNFLRVARVRRVAL